MDETKTKRPWWRRLRTWAVVAHLAVAAPASLWAYFVCSERAAVFQRVYGDTAPGREDAYRLARRAADRKAYEALWPVVLIAASSGVLVLVLIGTLFSDNNRQ